MRTFTVVLKTGREVGRYRAQSSSAAARKAGYRLLREKGQYFRDIKLRETTRGGPSQGKEYKYRIMRIRKPSTLTRRDGTEIKFRFRIKSKRLR